MEVPNIFFPPSQTKIKKPKTTRFVGHLLSSIVALFGTASARISGKFSDSSVIYGEEEAGEGAVLLLIITLLSAANLDTSCVSSKISFGSLDQPTILIVIIHTDTITNTLYAGLHR